MPRRRCDGGLSEGETAVIRGNFAGRENFQLIGSLNDSPYADNQTGCAVKGAVSVS
jgi:hypothetical protein